MPHSNPLAGVEQLARQVRAAGIREVDGNVVIDDRLFNTYSGWPDGVMSPIGINENFLDITATPTRSGQAARISYRPHTAAWRVRSTLRTTARGSAPSWQATQTGPNEVTVSGTVPAGAGPLLQVFFIPNPAAFARTAFIEALRRTGVSVAGNSIGPNPRHLLPRSRRYPSSRRVALRLSAPLSQIVKVILKVSANRGADLLVCLAAVKHGERNCPAGLPFLQSNAARLGSPPNVTFAFDGGGSDDRDRINPIAMTTFLRRVQLQNYGSAFRAALPIVGVNGTLATLGKGTTSVGRIQAKPGNRVAFATPGHRTRRSVKPGGLHQDQQRTHARVRQPHQQHPTNRRPRAGGLLDLRRPAAHQRCLQRAYWPIDVSARIRSRSRSGTNSSLTQEGPRQAPGRDLFGCGRSRKRPADGRVTVPGMVDGSAAARVIAFPEVSWTSRCPIPTRLGSATGCPV